MPALGDEFRAAREARHLSLSDVSEQIYIRSIYLQSIEDEDWLIAAPVYMRGFIRTYARFLGLEPEGAVEYFNAAVGDLAAHPHESPPFRRIGKRGPSIWLWAALVAAAVLVAFVGYEYVEFQQRGTDSPGAVVPASPVSVPTPAPSSAATARAAPAALERTLEIRVTAPSWLRVRVDGAQVLEGILPAGVERSFHGERVQLQVGNAGGVDLLVNGKDLGSMGASGAVVERTLELGAPK